MEQSAARRARYPLGEIPEDRIVPSVDVIGTRVTALRFDDQVARMTELAHAPGSGHFVCVANVHMLVEARKRPAFREVLASASMVTPDGMPLVWLMRKGGAPDQERVAGMDLLPAICARAAREGIGIFLLGATDEVLEKLQAQLRSEFPHLEISGAHAPPFRPLSEMEDRELTDRVNASSAGMLLIALGCPKQEEWMYAHRDRIRPLMIGLGAAFGVHAGMQRRAPKVMQHSGLEWLFRLAQEPRRLWRRYLVTNTLFGWYILTDALRGDGGKRIAP